MRRNGTVRCAIYTRKSSEEGLEQAFTPPLTTGLSHALLPIRQRRDAETDQ
jgi:hypothetical protein